MVVPILYYRDIKNTILKIIVWNSFKPAKSLNKKFQN